MLYASCHVQLKLFWPIHACIISVIYAYIEVASISRKLAGSLYRDLLGGIPRAQPQGDAIIAAFEVEHTTAIYSGLPQDVGSREHAAQHQDRPIHGGPRPAPGEGRL